MFTRAMATELGALFFDLSPANLIGKFNKPGDIPYLLSKVKQIALLNQPSIIYIDEVELVVGTDKKKGKKKGKGAKGAAGKDDGETKGASMAAEGY